MKGICEFVFVPIFKKNCVPDGTWSELDTLRGTELSTGRMDPRVGSGRVTILPDFEWVGSGQDFVFF